MFRKLFISLLILSAITSEGISALPTNYASYCIGSANEVSILAELNASAAKEQANSNGRAFLSDASSGKAFTLTQNTIEKLKYKNSYLINNETANNGYLAASSDFVRLQPEISAEKDNCYSKSGLSPPLFGDYIL